MAVTGAVIAGIGTAVSISEGREQARELKKQKVATSATEFSRRARERRAALRERRIKTGRLQAAAEATGVSGSSGELALESTFSTQFATNVGFGRGLQRSRDIIGASQIRVAKSQVSQAVGASLQRTGISIFSAEGGFDNLFGD